MNRDQIIGASSMPLASPAYPAGPYKFCNREYLIVTYESDPAAVRAALPEELEPVLGPNGLPLVFYEWMKMPDSSGFGDYEESGSGIVATYNGVPCNFSVQMYLDDLPPIVAGREIWGFPKKEGKPRLSIKRDTLTGTLYYEDERVAMGTMTYKHKALDLEAVAEGLGKLNVNLKILPGVDGKPVVAQLVGYRLQDIKVKGAWEGEARLHLVPHVNCRVADLPIVHMVGGRHLLVDFTLPYGEVLHDYLR